jgi:hypothetical protein
MVSPFWAKNGVSGSCLCSGADQVKAKMAGLFCDLRFQDPVRFLFAHRKARLIPPLSLPHSIRVGYEWKTGGSSVPGEEAAVNEKCLDEFHTMEKNQHELDS